MLIQDRYHGMGKSEETLPIHHLNVVFTVSREGLIDLDKGAKIDASKPMASKETIAKLLLERKRYVKLGEGSPISAEARKSIRVPETESSPVPSMPIPPAPALVGNVPASGVRAVTDGSE